MCLAKAQEAASAYPPVESSSNVAEAAAASTTAGAISATGLSSRLSDAESLLARGLQHLDIARRGVEELELGGDGPLPDKLRVEVKVAIALFTAAEAEEGDRAAPGSIAADVAYRIGEAHEILRNNAVAFSFLVKASDLKSAAALNALGVVLRDGVLGQDQDLRGAFKAFKESVEVLPNADAQW